MVLEANRYVRYACICDQDGKILWNSRRNDIESIITLEDTKRSLKDELEFWKKRNTLSGKIGAGLYSIDVYKKLKRITIPLRSHHLLYIHVEGEQPDYINDILRIVDWVEKNPA